MTKCKALVVVLGDLARSPRMQYHCLSLASNNYDVTVVARGQKQSRHEPSSGSDRDRSCEDLESDANIHQVLYDEYVDLKKYLPSVLALLIKPIWQTLLLINVLAFHVPRTHVILVQNPPAIPILPILYLYSVLLRNKLIIDWHNYGWSILALNLGDGHIIVRVYKFIELFFGSRADAGFCVSAAMRSDLIKNHHITYPIHVLYDRPPKHFKSLNLRERHNFYVQLKEQIPAFKSPKHNALVGQSIDQVITNDENASKFTMPDALNKNVVRWRPNRPALVMTSTSWTEDEDFELLYKTLDKYEDERAYRLTHPNTDECHSLPSLVCVITGKGPLKAYYERKITERKWEHIEVMFPWLTAQDYAKMVGSCDLGICLHKSSSGVDLPMKVVDMFGCGIPVLAFNYPAIEELIRQDFYGLTFNSVFDCCTKLCSLLADFGKHDNNSRDDDVHENPLARYKKNIKRHFLLNRWEDNWNNIAKPVFDELIKQ